MGKGYSEPSLLISQRAANEYLEPTLADAAKLTNVSFQEPGTYTFAVMLNGTEVATLPFNVVQMKKPSNTIS